METAPIAGKFRQPTQEPKHRKATSDDVLPHKTKLNIEKSMLQCETLQYLGAHKWNTIDYKGKLHQLHCNTMLTVDIEHCSLILSSLQISFSVLSDK